MHSRPGNVLQAGVSRGCLVAAPFAKSSARPSRGAGVITTKPVGGRGFQSSWRALFPRGRFVSRCRRSLWERCLLLAWVPGVLVWRRLLRATSGKHRRAAPQKDPTLSPALLGGVLSSGGLLLQRAKLPTNIPGKAALGIEAFCGRRRRTERRPQRSHAPKQMAATSGRPQSAFATSG